MMIVAITLEHDRFGMEMIFRNYSSENLVEKMNIRNQVSKYLFDIISSLDEDEDFVFRKTQYSIDIGHRNGPFNYWTLISLVDENPIIYSKPKNAEKYYLSEWDNLDLTDEEEIKKEIKRAINSYRKTGLINKIIKFLRRK